MEEESPNFFDMPDHEIMGMQTPELKEAPVEVEEPAAVETVAEVPAVIEEVLADTEAEDPATDNDADDEALAKDDKDPLVIEPARKTVDKTDPVAADKTPVEKKDDKVAEPAAVDYKAGYEKIMAPFKANGRDIKLESPEEAVKLMQMGANYTKKMQALQPTLRLVKMLENNQLLDEGQLSYLIDLHQKKPEAIQRLLADSKFDPLEADVEKAAGYVPGDHGVSDSEIQFQTVLEDVESTPTGVELIREVAGQWDADSKQALFKDPRLLSEINAQKANGLYGLISTEIERRRVLGDMQGVPFLAAYETVGKDLQAKGLLVPAGQEPPRQDPPVTRVVAPAPAVTNSDRARAAMPAKVVPASVKEEINYLAESDEAFLKRMDGRL